MRIKSILVALSLSSMIGCGGGGGSSVDLDAESGLWLASKDGKSLVLYTYPGSAAVLMDVRSDPHGATEGQYNGARSGTAEMGYTFQLGCLNPDSSPVCDDFGVMLTLACTVGASSPELVCGSTVFDKVTSDAISQ
ncbi:MAG: hypothetical protein QM820_61885 [Minicystis sp.]